MLRGETRKRYFGRNDKRKELKWKTSMQNTRLDEEKRKHNIQISEFERDGKVSQYTEKLLSKTCLWAENLKKKIILVVITGLEL